MQNAKGNNEREMVLTRTLNAPLELVWQAWTEQKHITKWWGPKGFTNPVCQWDAKAGNTIIIHMQAPDGVTYPMDGQFVEIVKPEKLVFLSAALTREGKRLFELHNTVTFKEDGNKTVLTIHITVSNITDEGAPYLDGMNMGWNQSIDKLDQYLQTI